MPGLPKKYIKKYGVSKRAWTEYRKSKNKNSRGAKVAKKKKITRKKMSRKGSFFGKGNTALGVDIGGALGAGAYGAGRQVVSNWLQEQAAKVPLLDKIPGTEYGDELLMMALNLTLKNGRVPLLNIKVPYINKLPLSKEIGTAGYYIEAARIGAGLASGMSTTTAKATNAPQIVG